MTATTQAENTALAITSASSGALLMDSGHMDRLERIAGLMASGKSTVPAHLRGSTGDCFAIVLQSMQWGMNPFAVAQKTHLVNGTLGYEAQLVAAVVNSSGAVKDRFHFEWFGEWEKIVGKFKEVESRTKKDDNGHPKKYIVPDWQQADEKGLGVRVWATIKGEDQPRILELLMTQARTRNSTLWTEDPKQQIAYLAQKRWSRLYTPDVILGVYTPDELAEPADRFMGTAEVVGEPPASPAPPLAYPQADFEKNLPAWAKVIATKRKSLADVIATVELKAPLSKEQKDAIEEAAKKLEANTVDAEPKAPGAPAAPDAPAVTYAQVMDAMNKATTQDALNEAATLIEAVADATQRKELGAAYDARLAELTD